MTVRPLGLWEEEDFLPLAQAFHAEADLGGTFDAPLCLALWRSLFERVMLGLFHEGKLVGALAGFVAPQLMTGARIAQEHFWYVLPEHRGGLAGIKMFNAFESWSKDRADGIIMASLADHPAIAELYKRRGYRHIESHYLKPLINT